MPHGAPATAGTRAASSPSPPTRPMDPVICTVDVVLLTLSQGALCVALARREREPFRSTHALPGGYVQADRDRDDLDAAVRVLRDKAGIESPYLEQLATFAGAARDPRGWSVSIAWYALVSADVIERAAHPGVRLEPVDALPALPFDHARIVRAAVERVRGKSTYSSLPVHLCPERFTLPQLQAVYEAVLGEPIDKVGFRRKVAELGVLEAIEGARQAGGPHRPAQLYRVRSASRHTLSTMARALNTG